MLKQVCRIGCCVLVLGLLSFPAWAMEDGAVSLPTALIIAHGGNGPGDGTGTGAPDGAGDCPGARPHAALLLAGNGNGGTGANGGNGPGDGTGNGGIGPGDGTGNGPGGPA